MNDEIKINEVVLINNEFKECSTCASIPGSPTLCPSCLHNRLLMDKLKACLKTFIHQLMIANRDGDAHIDNELVRTSMKLCDMDERLMEFREGDEDDT